MNSPVIQPPLPPHDQQAEEAVLGAMLIEAKVVIPKVNSLLKGSDFYSNARSSLFEVMCVLHERGIAVDLITVSEYLKNLHRGEDGEPTNAYRLTHGGEYLPRLMENCPGVNGVEDHARIIKRNAICRQVAELADQAGAIALTGDYDALAAQNGHYNLSALIATAQPAPPLQLLDAGQFLADVGTPPPFLVNELLPENCLILLSGKPKHGKSFMALDIADDVSQGKDVFGCYAVNRPGRVIYFSMEDSRYTLANRLLSRGIKAGDKRPLTVCSQRFQIGTQEGCDTLRRMIEPLKPVLIIVDTAAQSLGVKDWSNRSEITDRMGFLMELAREVCTVLLVAHNRKAAGEYGDEIAGSNAFTGAVDGWLSAQNKAMQSDGNMRVTYTMDGRDIRGDFTVEMDTKNLHFRALTKDEVQVADKLSEAEQATQKQRKQFELVAKALAAFGGQATASQLYDRLNMTQPTFSRLSKAMMEAGHLRESGKFDNVGKGRASALLTLCTDSEFYSIIQFCLENENE